MPLPQAERNVHLDVVGNPPDIHQNHIPPGFFCTVHNANLMANFYLLQFETLLNEFYVHCVKEVQDDNYELYRNRDSACRRYLYFKSLTLTELLETELFKLKLEATKIVRKTFNPARFRPVSYLSTSLESLIRTRIAEVYIGQVRHNYSEEQLALKLIVLLKASTRKLMRYNNHLDKDVKLFSPDFDLPAYLLEKDAETKKENCLGFASNDAFRLGLTN